MCTFNVFTLHILHTHTHIILEARNADSKEVERHAVGLGCGDFPPKSIVVPDLIGRRCRPHSLCNGEQICCEEEVPD